MNCEETVVEVDKLLQDPGDKTRYNNLLEHINNCDKCRENLSDVINTAAEISNAGNISDIVDLSPEFIKNTRFEAKKESDKFQMTSRQIAMKKRRKTADYIIVIMLAATVLLALAIFIYAMISL